MEWKSYFQSRIRKRGLDYYRWGYVKDFTLFTDGVSAKVVGSRPYHVEIRVLEHGDLALHCDCPYAKGGNYCKHEAAVLYQWEELNFKRGETKVFQALEEDIKDLIEKTPQEEINDFLLRVLQSDRSFYDAFKKFVDTDINVKEYEDSITNTIESYIDYHEDHDFLMEFNDLLEIDLQRMLVHKQYEEAFDISSYLLHEAHVYDAEYIEVLTNVILTFWHTILTHVSSKQKRTLFEKVLSFSLRGWSDKEVLWYDQFMIQEFNEIKTIR